MLLTVVQALSKCSIFPRTSMKAIGGQPER